MRVAMPSARGRWALVTGASAGIGEAFARILASEGANLVLVARREDRLNALAAELRSLHDIDTRVLVSDLSKEGAVAPILDALGRDRLSIDILISNAGRRDAGRFEDRAWAEHRAFLALMIGAGAELTHALLPAMRERRYGRIIHVSSLAAMLPGSAERTLYAAAKVFLVNFTESLAAENRALGVHATALCPGFTYSEFHPADVRGLRRLQFMRPEAVARAGLAACESGATAVAPGLYNKAVWRVADLLPRSAAARLVGVTRRGRRARDRAR
jgi:short-subunit dehydrogenase